MTVAGLGAGVCAAISNACVSATADPSRVAGIVSTVMIVSIATLTATLPLIAQLGSPASMAPAAMTLTGLGMIFLLAAFACRQLPPPPPLVANPATGVRQTAPRSMHLTMFTVALLFGFSDVGSYAFAEVLGIRQGGYSASGATLVLAASIFLSLGVAIGLTVFPVRRRARAALLTALLINTVGKTGAIIVTGQIGWAGSQFVWAIGTAATIVVMLAVAASHDPTGRLAAIVATGTSFGGALGPISAGAALDSGTEARLAVLVVIVMTGALLTALRVPTGSQAHHPIGSIAAVT
jgi:predicted MFS family arabinose efflux permease